MNSAKFQYPTGAGKVRMMERLSLLLSRGRAKDIGWKLLVPVMFIFTAILVVSQMTTFYFSRGIILKQIEGSEIQVSKDGRKKIENLFAMINRTVSFVGNLPVMSNYVANIAINDQDKAAEDEQDIQTTMKWVFQQDRNVRKISFVTVDGVERIALENEKPLASKGNFAGDDRFKKVISTREMVLSPIPKVQKDGRHVLEWFYPVKNSKALIGAIVVHYRFDAVVNVLKDVKVGKSGFLFLVGENGEVLYHPLYPIGQSLPSGLMAKFLAGGEGAQVVYNDFDGRSFVTGIERFTMQPWVIGASAPEIEVMMDMIILAAVVLSVIALLLVISWYVLTVEMKLTVVQPLQHLTGIFKKLSDAQESGSARLSVRSGLGHDAGEIGQLARSFDDMAEQLHRRSVETENFKRALDEHAIVCFFDSRDTITYVNDKFVEISGYKQAELLGQNRRLLDSGRHDAAFFADMRQSLQQARPWHGELCCRRKNGSDFWVAATYMPFFGADGAIYTYVTVWTDITRLIDMQEDLHQREAQLNVRLSEATSSAMQQANELALSAAEIAAKGDTVMSRMVETMGSISGSARKIVDIIGVIDGIAFQTNILALNAAVEAARAGDQGRGFAVVASEVRSLAQRSATAAKEIKTLIGESAGHVKVGVQLVDEAGGTMNEIVASVRRVTDVMGH